MQIVAIGKRLFEERTSLPEAVEYNYQAGSHSLLISMLNLSPSEIESVTTGAAEFGLYCENAVVYLLYRFEKALPWSDAAFSWWNLAEEDRHLPPIQNHVEERALLKVILTEAATGTVKAIRVMTFSPAFTRCLHDAIREQAAGEPFSRADYFARGAMVYQKFNPAELAARAIMKTRGGE